MEAKDWIQIVVEIVCNGVFLVLFGKWLDAKMKRNERRENAHSEIIKLFFEELVKLNKAMISVNITIQLNKISNIDEIMNLLKENILTQWIEIISFYDTYAYDLKDFETYYKNMDKAWGEFAQQTMPKMLGIKLQEFKEANQKLIAEVRKKYLISFYKIYTMQIWSYKLINSIYKLRLACCKMWR